MEWGDTVNAILNGAGLILLARAVRLLEEAKEVAKDVRRDLERFRNSRNSG